MKKSSLLARNIRRLILLGLVILIGAGTAGGIELYQSWMKYYHDMAYGYVNHAAAYLDPFMVQQIIGDRDRLTRYFFYDATEESGNPNQSFPEEFLSEEKGPDGEAYVDDALTGEYTYWWDSYNYFRSSANWNDDTLDWDFYVVIPEEEHMVLLWDLESDREAFHPPFTTWPYLHNEKKNLERVMSGEWDNDFTVYHDEDIMGTAMMGLRGYNNEIVAVVAMDVSMTDIARRIGMLILNLAVMLLLIMGVSVMVYYMTLKKMMINPLLTMKEASTDLVRRLKEGAETPLKMNIRTGDEMESLSHAMEDMGRSLQEYIRESRETAAEKEQFATEMRLAGRIQNAMLPDVASRIPEGAEIALSASMEPAKAVGGDFYDCFQIDEDHLALLIADVSGKGVPAALFMSMSSMLLRVYTASGLSPAEILKKVNEQIWRQNSSNMFVTVWLGILDLRTGLLRTANAGHEYPALKQPGGAFELVRDPHSLAVGPRKDIAYKDFEIQLLPGAMLFVYTDGVPEATNAERKRFGTDRMLETLRGLTEESTEKALEEMKKAVADFVGEAEQFDDMTMMCLRYKQGDGHEKD